jgi:hypothetical protein
MPVTTACFPADSNRAPKEQVWKVAAGVTYPVSGIRTLITSEVLLLYHRDSPDGSKRQSAGHFGLMDLVAGLRWLRENIPAFGGDPERITLLGHGTGAALSTVVAVSPVAKGTVRTGTQGI